MSIGIVYIARNDNYEPNIYKIGMTLRTNLNERMDELTSHTGVLGEFRHEGHVLVDDVEECERKLHEKFSDCRVQNNREFFRVPLREIIFQFNDIIADKIIRNNLPPITNQPTITLDYFLKFSNLMSFLRFYNNYGCGENYCGLCSSVPNTGLIIFLCKASGHDLSSKEKRFYLYRKLRGLNEFQYQNDEKESLINFRDLTKEYQTVIYKKLCDHFLNLNENESNNLSNKMIGLIKTFFSEKRNNKNLKIIFNQKFNNYFIELSKLNLLEINEFNSKKINFIKYLLEDLENDEELKSIFKFSALLEKIREDEKKAIAEQKAYNLKIQQEDNERQRQKELKFKQKQDQHKIFLENQKVRNHQRELYISKLKNMTYFERIRKIIHERPFGLCGIPQDLFEMRNFEGIINDLSIEDKKKLEETLSLRNEKFFKHLYKILKN